MALSTDQQAQVEVMVSSQSQLEQIRHENAIAFEIKRAEIEAKRTKLELVRMAKEVIVENKRSAPAEDRGVTPQEITEFAASLAIYVDA